jgi:hypothetical protein
MRIVLTLVLAAAAWAQLPNPDAPPTPERPPAQSGSGTAQGIPEDPSSRKARAMIQQMIQALGGQAYLSYQDMSQQGRTYSFYHGQPNSVGSPFWRFWQWPDKERVELLKDRSWTIIHNGDKGSEITFRGVAPEDAKQLEDYLRRREYSMEWVLRRWLNEPSVAIFYEGPAIVNQKPAEQVTIMNARNQAVTIALDSNTHLPVRKTFTWRDPTDRERNEEGEIYDNYRPVQGIMTPHSVSRTRNGETTNQRFIHSVSYNQGLAANLFEASAATAKPAKK